MLKSRVKRLEEKFNQSKEDQVRIIRISEAFGNAVRHNLTENSAPMSNPDETMEEFRERIKREGWNYGIWVGLED